MFRLLESTRVLGAVVVSAYHTDLGDRCERESGYFGREWKVLFMLKYVSVSILVFITDSFFNIFCQWSNMRPNCDWLAQWHSIDDPLVPVHEARHVSKIFVVIIWQFISFGIFG